MGVVLVLEPDNAQAEPLLRVLRKRVRAEAVLVTSTAAAIEIIAHAVPDLILVSALLSPRDEDRLMAHLRSLENAAHLQTLTIPRFAAVGAGRALRTPLGGFRKKKAAEPVPTGCDPDVFAQEISAQLVRALEIRSHPPAIRNVRRDPVPDFSPVEETTEDSGRVRLPPSLEASADPDLVPVQALGYAQDNVEPSRSELNRDADGVFLSEDSVYLDPPPVPMLDEITVAEEPIPVPVAQEPEDHLARLTRLFGFGSEMFKVADADAPQVGTATLPPALSALEGSVPSDIEASVRRDVAWTVPSDVTWHVPSDVVWHVPSEVARHVPSEVDWHIPSEVEWLKADTPEVPTITVDNSAERLAAQVAAVEAEARLAAELERVRAEGEARRLSELARLQAEADVVRDAAIVEARAAAEREARQALAAELTRVRSEAEGVFAADLARVRAEVEERLSAQVEAAETRLAAAEQARSAAEAAAAAALEAEVTRVRGEAEARLQAELERIRTEAEAARMAEQSNAKYATQKIREAAAREGEEARAIAETAAQRSLEAEMARVRAQADKFLQDEVARVRADAQERQAAELQELRAQMAEIRDTAAKTAAEQSADYYKIWQPAVAAAAAAEASPSAPEPEAKEPDALPEMEPGLLAERHMPWLKWAVPTAACMLFIANIGPSAKPAPPPAHVVEPVEKPFVEAKTTGALKVASTPAGARLFIDGRSYGQTPLTIPNLEPGQHTLVLRTGSGSITRRITIRPGQTAIASEAIFSGWVAIYSAVPMTVSLNGKAAVAGSDGRIMAPPGTYDVALVNERFNYHGSKTLEVRPGEVTAYTVALPSAPVHVVAPEGADITVDGSSAGKAPLADLSLPLGTHDITATLPDAGQRDLTIAVRYGETTEARVEFKR